MWNMSPLTYANAKIHIILMMTQANAKIVTHFVHNALMKIAIIVANANLVLL